MSDTAFAWTLGSILGGALILGVTLGAVIVAREPAIRQAYMADCADRGFTPSQCQLLYRQRQDADYAATLALAGVALSAASVARSR